MKVTYREPSTKGRELHTLDIAQPFMLAGSRGKAVLMRIVSHTLVAPNPRDGQIPVVVLHSGGVGLWPADTMVEPVNAEVIVKEAV